METEANEKNTKQQYCVPANASCLCPVTAQRAIQNSVTGVNESPEQKKPRRKKRRDTKMGRSNIFRGSQGDIYTSKKIKNINTTIK